MNPSASSLEKLFEEYHRSLDAFARGDPNPLKQLYSRSDDATLANPFGPPARGWTLIESTLEKAATHYADGRALGFDNVATVVTRDLAYIVELEHFVTTFGGRPDTRVDLRVTSAFRPERDGWRVCHRHADPITTPRGTESMLPP